MEVVLGVGNLVFVAIVANRADARPRTLARPAGLMLALVFRLAIHERVDPNAEEEGDRAGPRLGMAAALAQIVLIDIVFSIDSIITAVGMTNEFPDQGRSRERRRARRLPPPQPNRVHAGAELPPDRYVADRPTASVFILNAAIYTRLFFSSLAETLDTHARRKARKPR